MKQLTFGAAMAEAPFGKWLLEQKGRDGHIGELARWASLDPKFPVSGTVEDITARLTTLGADPDAFVALEDAELDWAAM